MRGEPEKPPHPKVNRAIETFQRDSGTGHAGCVFIVDTDAESRRAVGELAASLHVDSAGYASAEDFLAAFDESRSGCVVAETRLPGMSGLELVARLAPLRRRIPILLFAAHVDVPLAVEAMRLGASAVFEKPCRDEELKQAIAKALDISLRGQKQWALACETDERLKTLTAKERRVLDLLLEGKTNKAIAATLSKAVRTIEYDRQAIMSKMGVTSLVELVLLICEWRSARGENPTSI